MFLVSSRNCRGGFYGVFFKEICNCIVILKYACGITNRAKKNNIFTNPSPRAGYDTRSIFKRSLTGLNSEFSFC